MTLDRNWNRDRSAAIPHGPCVPFPYMSNDITPIMSIMPIFHRVWFPSLSVSTWLLHDLNIDGYVGHERSS